MTKINAYLDLTNIFTIALKEIHDARRNRWFVSLAVVFVLVSSAMSWFGLAGAGIVGVAGFGRTAASLLNLIIFFVPLIGLTMGAISIAGEREQGTLLTLLSQPITTTELLLGKFLGTAVALSSAILVGFGFSGLMIGWYVGTEQLGGFLSLLGWALLFGAGQLSLGFLISVFAPNSARALGIAIFIWLFTVFFSDLTLMSAFLLWRFPVQTLFWLALINPAQVFKISSIHTLQGNLELIGEAGLYARDILGDKTLTVLSTILVAWVLLPLSISLWLFGRRKGQ